jgi:hypothetical protein
VRSKRRSWTQSPSASKCRTWRQDRLLRSSLAIARDPDARAYTDQALTPGHDDDVILDLLTKTTGARAAVAHLKKIAGLTGPGRAA